MRPSPYPPPERGRAISRIYLDHAAAAPLRPEAAAAMAQALEISGGNPSSLHAEGRKARHLVEEAREAVAELAGCDPEELVFTSGGTEANRLALEGAVEGASSPKFQVIASEADHTSVLGCLEDLKRRGVSVDFLGVDREGRLHPLPPSFDGLRTVSHVEPLPLQGGGKNPIVLSLLWVNNETGTIQDLERHIGEAKKRGWTVHVDAAQGLGKLPSGILREADLISFSAAKIGGPAGIGALVVREGAAWRAPWSGGKQEGRRRPGTEAAIPAVGFGAAAKAALSPLTLTLSQREREFLNKLRDENLRFQINGPEGEGRLPGLVNLSFPRWMGDQLCAALDLAGVAASPGAACASGVVRFSHVLRAMGRSESEAGTGVRFSFGWNNTEAEVRRAAEIVAGVLRGKGAASPSPSSPPSREGIRA